MNWDGRGRPRTRGPSLDDLPRIDSVEWQKEGNFSRQTFGFDYSMQGEKTFSLTCRQMGEGRLSISVEWEDEAGGCTRSVMIEREARPLGGVQPWFLCPDCGARARHLYVFTNAITCRVCTGLPYESERCSGLGWVSLRLRKARNRLEWLPGDLPIRRKWQRKKAFERDLLDYYMLDEMYVHEGVAKFMRSI